MTVSNRVSREQKILLSLVFGSVAIVGVVLYLLIPDKATLLSRMLEDGEYERAAELFESTAPGLKESDPPLYELARLMIERGLAQRDAPGHLLPPEKSKALFKQGLDTYARRDTSAFLEELSRIIAANKSLSLATEQLDRLRSLLPRERFEILLRQAGQHAITGQNPAIAALSIRQQIGVRIPAPSELRKAITYWRAAGLPEEALKEMEHVFISTKESVGKPYKPLIERWIALLRELNRNGDAFESIISMREDLERFMPPEEVLDLLGATALGAKRQHEAIPHYREWLSQHPNDKRALERLAEIAESCNRLEEATIAVSRLLQIDPANPANQYRLAQLCEWQDEADKAFDLYKPLALQGNCKALHRMVALNPGLYRHSELMEALRPFVPEKGTSEEMLLLAHLLYEKGQYREALRLYQRHVDEAPDDVPTLARLASLYRDLEQLENALRTYRTILSLDPDHFTARHRTAQITYQLGNFDEALRLLRSLAHDSKNPEVMEEYIAATKGLGLYEEAIDALTLFITYAPSEDIDSQYFIELAYFHQILGQDEQQREVLKKGLLAINDNPQLRYLLAITASDLGDPEGALHVLDGHMDEVTDPYIWLYYINLLNSLGKSQDALRHLEKQFGGLYTQNPETARIAALVLENVGRHATALRLLDHILETTPQDPDTLRSYARVLQRMGRARELEGVLRRLDLRDNPAHIRLAGEIYSDLGRFREAQNELEKYCRIVEQPPSTIYRLLGDVRLSMGNSRGARLAYRRAVVALLRDTTGGTL